MTAYLLIFYSTLNVALIRSKPWIQYNSCKYDLESYFSLNSFFTGLFIPGTFLRVLFCWLWLVIAISLHLNLRSSAGFPLPGPPSALVLWVCVCLHMLVFLFNYLCSVFIHISPTWMTRGNVRCPMQTWHCYTFDGGSSILPRYLT